MKRRGDIHKEMNQSRGEKEGEEGKERTRRKYERTFVSHLWIVEWLAVYMKSRVLSVTNALTQC